MPRPIRTVTALLLLPTLATAQDARPAPQGWSAYFAMGSSSIPGTTPLGAAAPAGSMGVAYERPVSGRLTWRAELGYGAAAGAGGPAASVFADESTVQLLRTHLGASVRRYTGRNAWVAGGMAIAFRNDCYVDIAGGVGVTGTSSIDCADFADRTYEVPAVAADLTLGAGFDLGRFGLGMRLEQGLTPSVRVDGNGQRQRAIEAELSWRFGRAFRGAEAPPRGRRATAPLAGQVSAGTIGWALGAVAGMVVGSVFATDENDWATPLVGGIVTAPVGATIAIHRFGRARGLRSNPLATLGGAYAGMVGGPAMWVTSPAGAAIAYNAFSREAPAPSATHPASGRN